jgi:hypothetical protein
MMKILSLALAFSTLAFASGVHAAGDVTQTVAPQTPLAIAPAPIFLKPVFLRGTLGELNIQINLRPKEVADEGLEGEYFVFGRSAKILLAGEAEGDSLFLEESENGTDISGQWDGKLDGDTLIGSWMSADGLVAKPFNLKVITLKSAALPARAQKTFTNPRQ